MLHLVAALSLRTTSIPVLAFRHVTVVDVRAGSLRPNCTVVIRGDRIVEVEPAGRTPKGATVIEAKGKYMIPGLWDMHAHNDTDENTRNTILPLMIANGVTGIRDMCGDVYPPGNKDGIPLEVVNGWRKDIADGKLSGPRIVAGSTLVDGLKAAWPSGSIKVGTPEDGRQAADYVKKRGNDFLKVYSFLPRPGYLAMAAECKRIGLVFAGHVPESVTAEEASNAGQKSMEHLLRVVEGCCTQPDDPGQPSKPLYLKKAANKLRLVATFSPSLAQKEFAVFVKNRTWQCPTLAIIRSSAFRDQASFRKDPRIKLLPKSMTEEWQAEDKYWKKTDPAYWAATRKLYSLELKVVGMMGKAGVPLLAGTDAPTDFTYPGSSLHDELQLFVSCGLTPLEALRSATLAPAEYFGRTSEMGNVRTGMLADLVLLDRNPISDVRNTTSIRAVVADGRYYSRAALDKLQSDVRSHAR
jgi:hypothetical protein